MIYQIKFYYGALLNGQAIYSLESSFQDCTKFPNEIDEKPFKDAIEKAIVKDGLNPDDFEIGFLTEEQYKNRFSPETEETRTFKLEKESV